MKEEIFQIHRYSVGYKIDKQLLLSLKDIFEQYSEKSVFRLLRNAKFRQALSLCLASHESSRTSSSFRIYRICIRGIPVCKAESRDRRLSTM